MDEKTTRIRPKSARAPQDPQMFSALDNPDDMAYEGNLPELENATDPVEFRQVAPDDHD